MWPMMVSMELARPSWGPRGTTPQPGQASPSRAARAWRLAQQLRRPLQAEPPTLGRHARGRHGAGKGAQGSLAPGPVSGHGVQEGVRLKWNGWRPSQCRANPEEQRRAWLGLAPSRGRPHGHPQFGRSLLGSVSCM